jgi:serine/threonine protein kinase
VAPDRYQLIERLGGGGEGDVWQARLPLSEAGERTVAIKILNASEAPSEVTEWERYGQLLQSLNHPGIVRVTDAFIGPPMHLPGMVDPTDVDPDAPTAGRAIRFRYLVMDYVDGISLQEWLDENPDASASRRLRRLATAAAALDEMHSGRGTRVPVAHGDVKPSNIIIRPDGSSVLVDLGLVRLADGAGRRGRSRPYAAPELFIRDAVSTPQADRFAFAATVYHALVGTPPPIGVNGPDLDAIRHQLSRATATSRRPQLATAIVTALTIAPEERCRPDLRSWLTGLSDTLSQISEESSDLSSAPVPRSAQKVARGARRGRRIAPIAVIVGAVLIGGIAIPLSRANKGGQASTIAPTTTASRSTSPPPTSAPARMPNVVGARAEDAQSQLAGLGVQPRVVDQLDASHADGTVVAQTPAVGAVLSSETSVVLKIARSAVVTYLADMQELNNYPRTGPQSISGHIYAHSIYDEAIECGDSEQYNYDLGRHYRRFLANVGINDSAADSSVRWQFEILVDGRELFNKRPGFGVAAPVDIDVTGALRLTLRATRVRQAQNAVCPGGPVFGDPRVLGLPGEVPPPTS